MKTETSSFRLEKEIFEDFKKYAKDQNLTANSLVNKIMKVFMEWGSKAPAIQIIPEDRQALDLSPPLTTGQEDIEDHPSPFQP